MLVLQGCIATEHARLEIKPIEKTILFSSEISDDEVIQQVISSMNNGTSAVEYTKIYTGKRELSNASAYAVIKYYELKGIEAKMNINPHLGENKIKITYMDGNMSEDSRAKGWMSVYSNLFLGSYNKIYLTYDFSRKNSKTRQINLKTDDYMRTRDEQSFMIGRDTGYLKGSVFLDELKERMDNISILIQNHK